MTTILFARTGNDLTDITHHEYSASEMREVFTKDERDALQQGRQVTKQFRKYPVTYISATAVCSTLLRNSVEAR